MAFTPEEILETIRMVQLENLDVRTVTAGISLVDCASGSPDDFCKKLKQKITAKAGKLKEIVASVEEEYGIPIVHRRLSLTPLATILKSDAKGFLKCASVLDELAEELGFDFIGGYSALVQKGMTENDRVLIESLPDCLSSTGRVCASVNVASSRSGINLEAIRLLGQIIKEAAEKSRERDGLACAKLVIFANAPEDNPFMAGAFHGHGEADMAINIGVSGPGVVRSALKRLPEDAGLGQLVEEIKRTSFKITRVGELIGREVAARLGAAFGIVDLSLAPTPEKGDSVAEIIELLGVEKVGAPGSTAALALLVDAVKKGGMMASSYVGGLSGAFIPVSEDRGMAEAVKAGALNIEKLEALTSICSVGLDMVPIPGNTPAETISGLIADEMAIGVVNHKTTATRIIPVPGKKAGEMADFGGLLGASPIMPVSSFGCASLIKRGGRIPAPIHSFRG